MNLLLSDALVFGLMLVVGVLMMVGALLHRAGITWPVISPGGFRGRPVRVGASLLLGAGFVMMAGTHFLPHDHQGGRGVQVLLKSLTLCLFLASLAVFAISARTPGTDEPEHN